MVLRQKGRFFDAWRDMARKIDSLGSAGVFSTNPGLKLSQDEVRACFFLYQLTIHLNYDHLEWFQDRNEDFLMPCWDRARKIDSVGSAGCIFDEFGSKIVTR